MPILVSAMERHGHLQLAPEVLAGLLTMSAATMDRVLREARGATGARPRRCSPPSAAIRRSVAVRTFSDWDDPPPGFMEAGLVAHSGPTAKGSFVQTLTLTDIATGWTECAPVLVREQKLLTEMLSELREVLAPTARTLEAFLSGLRTAWRDGEVRPTSMRKEKVKRGRRRPDPLVAVTAQLQGWFEAEPWWSARELLERLQDEQPGSYPTGLLRTVQRRLKIWRRDKAHELVFGATPPGADPAPAPLSSVP